MPPPALSATPQRRALAPSVTPQGSACRGRGNRGRGRGRGRSSQSRGNAVVGDRGLHWDEESKRLLLNVAWRHKAAYGRISDTKWFGRVRKEWKRLTGNDHKTLKRRFTGLIDDRREQWRAQTEGSGTENETDYTNLMDRFIREVWDRVASERVQAEGTLQSEAHAARRTERDRDRMASRRRVQAEINEESDEDETEEDEDIDEDGTESLGSFEGAGEGEETRSVDSDEVQEVPIARRGGAAAGARRGSSQRGSRGRGGSTSSSNRGSVMSAEESLHQIMLNLSNNLSPASAPGAPAANQEGLDALKDQITTLRAEFRQLSTLKDDIREFRDTIARHEQRQEQFFSQLAALMPTQPPQRHQVPPHQFMPQQLPSQSPRTWQNSPYLQPHQSPQISQGSPYPLPSQVPQNWPNSNPQNSQSPRNFYNN
jgi:hypothetical protein